MVDYFIQCMRREFSLPAFNLARSSRGFALFVVAACVLNASTAIGQLRSGRLNRELYADEALNQTMTSSYVSRPKIDSSVRSATAGTVDQSVVTASYQSGQEHSVPCDDCGTSADYGSQLSSEDLQSYAPIEHGIHGCGDGGCDTCGGGYSDMAPTCTSMVCQPGCGPLMTLLQRTRVRAEVPLFWRRAAGPPALVTTSPVGTDADVAGQLGQPTTSILLGDGILDDSAQAGVRIHLSTWLGQGEQYAVMFRYWNAGDYEEAFNFDSNNFPVLARPFLNTTDSTSRVQDTQLISFPGDTVGNVSASFDSSVDGLELSLKRLLYQDRFTRIDWLYGYQHVSIDEGVNISSLTNVTGNVPGLQGTSIAVTDRFETQNTFHGASYGLTGTREVACWKIETLFRLGFGNLRREVNINGTTTTTSVTTSNTTSEGLLARNTNRQPFVDDTFVVIPEVGINFAYCIRRGLDFTVGYNYMLVPKVAQASQQISDNLAVNLSDPLVGVLDPALNFDEREYWINSLGLGLQWRY